MTTNPRFQILLKEIELIQDSVKNLDNLIFKTKNFAFLFWGGSLFLITDQLAANEAFSAPKIQGMIFATVLIPIAFWGVHFYWQKYLLMLSERERRIAWFMNSSHFLPWVEGKSEVKFPVYDTVGWIFTQQEKEARSSAWKNLKLDIADDFLIDEAVNSKWKILMYKGAKFYYPIMIASSIAFGLLYGV